MTRDQDASYKKILAEISDGSHLAFARLYDIFYPDLIRYIGTKLKDHSTAEDIANDLFLSLWKNRSTITDIDSIAAYLFSSCRYGILEYLRKVSSKQFSLGSDDLDVKYEETPLDERLHYRFLLDVANSEIENLPNKCRTIFKMSREEMKTNREIATKLGLSESTVENQINIALKRIRMATKRYVLLTTIMIY